MNRVTCSFCGKSQDQVMRIIQGPGVNICDECIEHCMQIINADMEDSSEMEITEVPKPKEILEKKILIFLKK